MLKTTGIHHISSVVGHAQRNVDFYASVLGLRLVKKTVNFDDKDRYHLYYGNANGSTGLTTTFPFSDGDEGFVGAGQVGVTAYAISSNAFSFWKARLAAFNIPYFEYERFGKKRIGFTDPDGIELELIEGEFDQSHSWSFDQITKEAALIGIQQAVLYSKQPEETLRVLTDILGYERRAEDEEMIRLTVNDDLGGALELNKKQRTPGKMGVGTVHHIAFKIQEEDLEAWREKIKQAGYRPTEIKNRKYFQAIYFREKGGILIELSTVGPGILIDETVEELGGTLLIPPHYAEQTEEILAHLMPVEVRKISKMEHYGYRDRYEYELLQRRNEMKKAMKRLKEIEKERPLSQEEAKELADIRTQIKNSK